MNKAFNKYGKVSFKSIIPKRLKVKRAIKSARTAMFAAITKSNIQAIQRSNGDKIKRQDAIAKIVTDFGNSVVTINTRSDHPIHKKAAN